MITKVVCAIIEKEGHYLIALRKEPMSNPGRWEFPGGKVNLNESNEKALKRELFEEFGADITVDHYICETFYEYHHLKIQLIAYKCQLNNDIKTLLEHEKIQWTPIDELMNYNWTPADIPIVKHLQYLNS